MSRLPSNKIYPGQRGAALVVGLIFLLVMTLIGVAAMRSTGLQERMAGNLRDRSLAFQAGEAALRAGEQWLSIPANLTAADTHTELAAPQDWTGAGNHGSAAGYGDDNLHDDDPVFHVSPPRLVRVGSMLPPEYRRIYEVTARGVGGSETAVVIVQSKHDPQ